MADMQFGQWLETTRDLQREYYDGDPAEFKDDARADFILWNVLAATDELHEALQEVGWKPWATGRGWMNRDAFVGEMVDVMHFVANLLVTANVTGEELSQAYMDKVHRNEARMASGKYDGRDKCPACGRALDDSDTLCSASQCSEEN
jgi:hypothetical protein